MKANKNIITLVLFLLMSTMSIAQSNLRDYQGTWQGTNDNGNVYLLQINFDYTATLTIDGKSADVRAVRINASVSPAEFDLVVSDPVSLDESIKFGIAEIGETDNGGYKLVLEYDEGSTRPVEFISPIVLIKQ